MHPLVRVICLILMAGFVASGNLSFVLISAILLAVIYARASVSFEVCWALIRRMRWFFLSILVVYFWFTPGRAFSPQVADLLWVPSADGVEQGLLRVACLVVIIAGVSALLQSTRREQLFAAIFSLVSWTRYMGLSPERFAVRATLTLETMAKVQTLISGAKAHLEPAANLKARIANLAGAISGIFVAVYKNAHQAELSEVAVSDAESVALSQWLFPLGLLSLYLVLPRLISIPGAE